MLQLLETLTPPNKSPQWHCEVAPGGQYVGVAAEDRLDLWKCDGNDASRLCRFRLPTAVSRGQPAINPDGKSIALATRGTVWGMCRGNENSLTGSIASSWGEPRALSFDHTGDVLLASFEHEQTHRLCALDWGGRTLGLYGVVEWKGPADGRHRLQLHPEEPLVVVEVSDPRHGTSLTFVRLVDGSPRKEQTVIVKTSQHFSSAGFSPQGDRLAGVFQSELRLWSWPQAEMISTVGLHGGLFTHQGCYVGENLVALARDKEGASFQIAVFDAQLTLQKTFSWNPKDQQQLQELHQLADDRLLIVGDRRAAIFALKSS